MADKANVVDFAGDIDAYREQYGKEEGERIFFAERTGGHGVGPNYHVQGLVREFDADIDEYRQRHGKEEGERLFFAEHSPINEFAFEGNLVTTNGANLLWSLFAGAGGTVFNNANARICVGDSTTAAAVGQTDLQGTSTARVAMDGGFPTRTTNSITFQATAGTGVANFSWQEWGIANASSGGTLFNRKVENLGTKTSAVSRQITAVLSA
jgi:hypothetical protein